MDVEKTFEEQLRMLRRISTAKELADAGSLIDWKNPVERTEYLREKMRMIREWWLNKLTPRRICACCCQGPRPNSRSWCILPLVNILHINGENAKRVRASAQHGEVAVCRSCAMLHFSGQWGKGASRKRLMEKLADIHSSDNAKEMSEE